MKKTSILKPLSKGGIFHMMLDDSQKKTELGIKVALERNLGAQGILDTIDAFTRLTWEEIKVKLNEEELRIAEEIQKKTEEPAVAPDKPV